MRVLCPSSSTTKPRGCSAELPNAGKAPKQSTECGECRTATAGPGNGFSSELQEGDVGLMVLNCSQEGRLAPSPALSALPSTARANFWHFASFRYLFCFVFLVFYNLKQVKTKLLLVQHSHKPSPSPAMDLSIFMYYEHYLGQELCSRLWNDELCK